jgi:hypothetical protein
MFPPSDDPFVMFLFNPIQKKENPLIPMKNFEVDFETTVPPWHTGHEKYEAEDLATAKMMFRSKHEAARIFKVAEVLYDERTQRLNVI